MPTATPIAAAAFFASTALTASAFAQVRFMDYNPTGAPRGTAFATIISAIGNEAKAGITKPIDILTIQEQNSVSSDTQALLTAINAIYGAGTYARGTVNNTTNSDHVGVIYRVASVQLVAETEVANALVGTTGATQAPMRYQFRPVGYGAQADFYIYNSHYKSSNTASDIARRGVEANAIRANSDALPAGSNVIYTGDFNIYTSAETMWTSLTAAGVGQGIDPINRVGTWTNNSSFRDVHTQSPVTTARYGGQVNGGMDDRFDWQLSNAPVQDSEGFAIIPGTYRAFGNNGTHTFNGEINTGTGAPADALEAIMNQSDHLPVVADYQIPAKMAVTAPTGVPARIIKGTGASATVNVSNVAPVTFASGADELDYTVTPSGSLTGSAVVSTDAALGTTNNHSFTLNTSTTGAKTATIAVSAAASQAVENGTSSQNVSFSVFDHSNPSFSLVSDTDSLTLNFGTVAQGSGTSTLPFSVGNFAPTNAVFTALLDLDSFSGSGNTSVLTTSLATFANQAGNAASSFNASLNASTLGNFSATYSIQLSDETITGGYAFASQVLTLTISGSVEQRQWFTSGSGTWSSSADWLGAVPSGIDQPANFLTKITGPAVVTLDGSRTVGSLTFSDTDGYTVSRADTTSTLTLQSATTSTINVLAGSQTLAVPVALASNTTVDTAAATQLTLSAGLSTPAGVTLVKQGAGKLVITNGATLAGPLTINAGEVHFGGTVTTADIVNHAALRIQNASTVGLLMGTGTTAVDANASLATNGFRQATMNIGNGASVVIAQQASRTTSLVSTLDIAGGAVPTARLDIGDNLLVVNYDGATPKSTVDSQITAGRGTANANGLHSFTGLGITSAIAAAQNALAGFDKFVVAAIDNADYVAINGVGYTSFSGIDVDATTLLIRYTYAGDANLDGTINAADYSLINSGFAGTIANYGWLSGDFNADGTIDASDYAVIDFGYLFSMGSPLGAGAPVAVPEPAGLGLASLLTTTLLGRRRRSR